MELFVNTRPTKQLPAEEDRAETAGKNQRTCEASWKFTGSPKREVNQL